MGPILHTQGSRVVSSSAAAASALHFIPCIAQQGYLALPGLCLSGMLSLCLCSLCVGGLTAVSCQTSCTADAACTKLMCMRSVRSLHMPSFWTTRSAACFPGTAWPRSQGLL